MKTVKKLMTKLGAIAFACAMLILPNTMEVDATMLTQNQKQQNLIADTAVEVTTIDEGISVCSVFYPNAVVTGDGVRLRNSPSSSGTVLEVMYSGEYVYVDYSMTATYGNGQWCYVKRASTSTYGWVSAQYIQSI